MLGNVVRSPHRLQLILLAVMVLLASTVVLLGYRIATQDELLFGKQRDDQKEAAAGMAIVALQQRITAIERTLSRILSDGTIAESAAPPGSVFFDFLPESVRSWPDDRLVYLPSDIPEAEEAPDSLFDRADEVGIRNHDRKGAISLLNPLAESRDAKVSAAALVRIAGFQRESGQFEDALKTYKRAGQLGAVSVGGLPAALSARLGAMTVYKLQNERQSLTSAARDLADDLNSGRWAISLDRYQSLTDEVRSYVPEFDAAASPHLALAEGVQWLWEKKTREGTKLEPGRKNLPTSAGPVLVVWRTSGSNVAGFAANVSFLTNAWIAEIEPELKARHARLVLTDSDSIGSVYGTASGDERTSFKPPSTTGLPWTVQTASIKGSDGELIFRRRLFFAGTAALLLLILTGGWFVSHAVERELAVGRLQSDFISVVSHEFRTPLTALCQLSEMLKRGRLLGEAERNESYDFLYHESNRLRRLVGSLLDFGRLESGKMQFRFEPTDAGTLLQQETAEFTKGEMLHSHHLEVVAPSGAFRVRADHESLRCVIRNLLENAVKYSPDCDTVWVNLARNNGNVEIAVRDGGAGIPHEEQRRIFQKFVRGSSARTGNVTGTGIGLATARHIVRAHGGSITVNSEQGKGSTFRIVLPLIEEKWNDTRTGQ